MNINEFEAGLLGNLPQLSKYAFSLTKNSVLAEDLAQETIAKALAGRDTFTPGNLFAWLKTILWNTYCSELKKRRHEGEYFEGMAEQLIAVGTPEEVLIYKEQLKSVLDLAPDFREALLLVAEGFTNEQAAIELGVPAGTVKSRASRARRQLRMSYGRI